MNKKKILIINSYAPNRGDSAIIQSTIDTLKGTNTEITVSIAHPQYMSVMSGIDVISRIPANISILTLFELIVMPIFVLLSKLNRFFLRFLSKEHQKVLIEYFDSDIILSAGGHHLTDINGLIPFLLQSYQLFLAILIGKPTVIYSQTIGPFIRFPVLLKFITKFILNRVKLIMVREEQSKDILINDLKIKESSVHLTADIVFLLKPSEANRIKNIFKAESINDTKNKLLVGITVYKSKYYNSSNPEKKFIDYKETMAKMADFLIETFNATVIFIPMEMQYNADIPLIVNITDLMQHRNDVKILRNIYSSKDTMGIIKELDLFIGAKTHSIIFSLSQCTPVLCIAYHPKSQEFMKMFNVEKYSMDIESLDFKEIKDNIEDLINEKETVEKKICIGISKIQNQSQENVKLFNNFLNEL